MFIAELGQVSIKDGVYVGDPYTYPSIYKLRVNNINDGEYVVSALMQDYRTVVAVSMIKDTISSTSKEVKVKPIAVLARSEYTGMFSEYDENLLGASVKLAVHSTVSKIGVFKSGVAMHEGATVGLYFRIDLLVVDNETVGIAMHNTGKPVDML